MDNTTISTRLTDQFGARIQRFDSHRGGDVVVYISASDLIDVATFLRDDDEMSFSFLENLCGVDYLGRTPRFEVVYHLLSMKNRVRVCLKVGLDAINPTVPSLTGMWQTANYQEREAYDMFGIIFTDHPGLDRILMPEDWVGFPQRKDTPLGYEEVAFTFNQAQIDAHKPFAKE
jgi:NADH-quinone oxidoreductase subunit C